ncbi:MAG: peptide deformylase [Solirubrobacteraceae bacterium]|nr:peptide deformylase [Solirubrobacteraceae bacterium]
MADEEQEDSGRYELTPEEKARREKALEQIVQVGDPVLRTNALPITTFDQDLISFAAHMVALMDDAIGVGLAAPQVGRPLRMFVYRVDGDGDARAIVNPVVEPIGDEVDVLEEGCLSIVGVQVPVERPVAIRLTAQTVDGKPIDEEIHGFSARIIQHETDHLDGVLITERTTPEARRAALKAIATGVPMRIEPAGDETDASPTPADADAEARTPDAAAEPAGDRA